MQEFNDSDFVFITIVGLVWLLPSIYISIRVGISAHLNLPQKMVLILIAFALPILGFIFCLFLLRTHRTDYSDFRNTREGSGDANGVFGEIDSGGSAD